jgi:hypothetical protein
MAGKLLRLLLTFFLLAAAPGLAKDGAGKGGGESPPDALLKGFRTPPQTARPRVLWPWMNGNIARDGIRKDIEWMHRVGIAGMTTADAAIDTPQVVARRLPYMSKEWKGAFRTAAGLAGKYGMELGIFASPGWSMTGGPWVAPQAAMKKLVWSETRIEGGKPFHGVLATPPHNPGPLQNLPAAGDTPPAADFYRDSVVIAYRAPVAEPEIAEIASNTGRLDAASLSNGDLTDGATLTPAGEEDVWIRAVFRAPATIQGVTLAMTPPKSLGYRAIVEAGDDGESWRQIAEFPPAAQLQRMQIGEQTVSFAPVTARYFRIALQPAPALPRSLRPTASAAPGAIVSASAAPPPRSYAVHELIFHAAATVHEFEKKAMFAAPPRDFYTLDGVPDFAPGSAIDPASVVVLDGRMQPDGTLDWTPPPGDWIVLRMGYSLTGAGNHPAPPEATGLEVDKLNRDHVRAYLETYLDTYAGATGAGLFGKRGLRVLNIDSSEAGQQNWTENILAEFRRLRGYDPAPWLPALTGAAVKSPADSDLFLWDFRRTVEELFARNHYGTIAEVARARGLKSQGEALEDHRPTFGDDMEMRRYFAMPMAAMWTYGGDRYPATLTYEADILGAASVAHVYGQNLVGAESLTSDLQPWAWAPGGLKPFIDMEFARGTNLVFLHTSVHQPVDRPPGLSLGGYGQFFNRQESWAELARPWLDYIARSSFLLQQGRFVADIAYFYGEEAPIASIWGNKRVGDVPSGYAFDFFNRDALGELSVENGMLATPAGMRYRVLFLGGSSRKMTLAALRRLAHLAEQGAVVVGVRPTASPSLADDAAGFQAEADALFGPAGETAERAVGRGRVFPSGSLAEAFAALDLAPDFDCPPGEAHLLFLHRRLSDGDVYFVGNRGGAANVEAGFRVTGKIPEIWDAVTGTVAPVSYRIVGSQTRVHLDIPKNGSSFVVFRKPATALSRTLPLPVETTILTLNGPWSVAFLKNSGQKNSGAPAKATFAALTSWSDSNIEGVKYFSGIGAYSRTFKVTPAMLRAGGRLVLDLGEVREMAEATLNGKKLGTVWTAPFLLDISKAVKPGRNVLRVKVANLWVNRLIGDAQPDVKKKFTFTIIPTYRPDAPLRPSGLLGPVSIRRVVSGK